MLPTVEAVCRAPCVVSRSNVRDDLHRVGDAFGSANLLLRSERNLLNEFSGLADHSGNCFEALYRY